jgi:hypothetical protein
MAQKMLHRPAIVMTFAFLAGALVLALGLAFALAVQPAQAGPLAQDPYPIETPTTDPFLPTATTDPQLPTATTDPQLPTATQQVAPTVTATQSGTMPPPQVTGTPTQLVPITGDDLTPYGSPAGAGAWVALWLVGMLLILVGLRAKLARR